MTPLLRLVTTPVILTGVLSATLIIAPFASAQEPASASSQAASPLAKRFTDESLPFVRKHCFECHGEKDVQADLSLFADTSAASVVKRRAVWESVVEMVSTGQMPPSDKPRPEQADTDKFLAAINAVFEDHDLHAPLDPGRVTVRRLNRVEYNRTVRDLMGIDFNAAEDFPSDDIGHGFDNIGDVLTVSPVLMERYLAAAESIVNKAILVGPPPPPPKRHLVATFLRSTKMEQFREVSVRSLEAAGNLSTVHKLTVAGEYILRFRGWGRQVGTESVKIAFRIDDNEIGTNDIKATKDSKGTFDAKPVWLEPGERRVAIEFRNPEIDAEIANLDEAQRALFVQFIELEGPLDMIPPSHKMLLKCDTTKSKPEQTREVMNRFLARAYRRPVTKDEVERLVVLATLAQDEGLSWEASMQRAMLAALVSPKFLFRLELDDRPNPPATTEPSSPNNLAPQALDEYQLASRLSYFLWSTMPDDELFALAGKGELTQNLDAQVRRMLADPKSRSLVDQFAMQWLQLQRLKTVSPDTKLFPQFDDALRAAMFQETELFIDAIIHEDRSILDLIDADFTFVNRPLARHYGLENAMSKLPGADPRRRRSDRNRELDFERITLPDKQRGGLLTQASILTVTSNPTRTSPVKRGRWILEQILGAPPPPPPPNVPELPEGDKAQLTGSLRQRMEQHRANPSCANCHAKMDPLGFAFENFDAIGGFRQKDGEFPIETAGVLPGGKTFQGPAELKTLLMEQRSKLSRNLTEKLMTYALGRGLEHYDRRAVLKIQTALEQNGYKFSTLAIEIAKSDPFRMKRGE
ncbi:MAG: DUF1592 domain-containing protein [Planctomycetales bacterium]|nr:DUF1592 domain-containing protein [Planctomycetales bacterium]